MWSILKLNGAAVAEWLSSWLAEQEDRGSIPRLATWIFRDWLSPASKSRYGWKIAKSTLIKKTTNKNNQPFYNSTNVDLSMTVLFAKAMALIDQSNLINLKGDIRGAFLCLMNFENLLGDNPCKHG